MFRALLVLGLVALAGAQGGQAQQATTGLVPGRRIRIHQSGVKPLAGEFVSMGSDGIRLTTSPADTQLVPKADITGVDLSQGTKSKAGSGAVTGLLVGAAGGALLGVAGCSGDESGWVTPGQCAGAGALVFGALGAGIGALLGSGKRTDKWAPTAWPTVSFQPFGRDGGTVALGMHLRF
jgi:hypothetical protein